MENRMRIGGFVLTAVIVAILISIHGRNVSNTASPQSKTIVVPFTELAHGTQSSVATRTNYLITSASELEKLWKMIDAKGNPPAVDFSKNFVAAIFAGRNPTAHYAISVLKVEDDAVRTVVVAVSKPDKTCPIKGSTTAPYELITLPKTSLAFAHRDQATANRCSQ